MDSKIDGACKTLYELVMAANESLDTGEVLQAVLDKTMVLFKADYGGVYTVGKDGFELKFSRNISSDVAEDVKHISADDRHGETHVVSEKLGDKKGSIPGKARSMGIQSYIHIPLKYRGRVEGLLILASREYDAFSSEDVKVADVISSPIGLVIDNANVHRRIRGIDQYTFALMNSIQAAVMTIQSHRILWCNPLTLEMFGYKQEEITGKSMKELVKDEETYETIRRNLDYAVENKGGFCFEFKAARKDGTSFNAECCVSLLKQEANDPYIIVAVIRDVSREKMLEEKVRKLEDKKKD
ncbi:MAG: PAS domain S-box protein [Candidatus Altiarchaeota archaeon]